MKESDNLKPTEKANSSEVKPAEEKEILASLKAESFSFVPDKLDAIMAKTQPQEALKPEEEKAIVTSLKEEASAFVPDKLQDIMKACGLDNAMSAEEQEEIVNALEGEGQAFVPHDLGAVKKATGTYNPYLDQDSLATQEKLHNEGAKVVPDVSAKVYQETGAKKHFSLAAYFKKHWIPLTSGFAVAAAAIAVVVVVPNVAKQTSASGTYVSVTITPASALATTTTSGLLSPTSITYDINKNTPSWSFLADANNTVKNSSFTPTNLSGSLLETKYQLSSKIVSGIQAYEAVAKLVGPSYEGGYLQNIQQNNAPVNNGITINIYSTDASYASKYQSDYQTSLNSALTSSQVYASVTFNTINVSDELLGVGDDEGKTILHLYSNLSTINSDVTLALLKKKDASVLSKVESILNQAAEVQVTARGLEALKQGLAYFLVGRSSALTAAQVSDLRGDIAYNFRALPWCYTENSSLVLTGIHNDGYYLVGDAILGTDSRMVWDEFKKVRDYLISKANASTDDALSLLAKTEELVTESTGYAMPDGYNQEKPDDGHHEHGEPGQGDWHGGIGDFGPGGGQPH
jgi:VIT1/CCC1 family predicted Fe2+/Mn2+ transporter